MSRTAKLASHWLPLAAGLMLAGCGSGAASTVTLYRNSPFSIGERVHWATFDSTDSSPGYNENNCTMAARLLNANYAASAHAEGKEPSAGVGFWCEAGSFEAKGRVPQNFPAAFPTGV